LPSRKKTRHPGEEQRNVREDKEGRHDELGRSHREEKPSNLLYFQKLRGLEAA